MNIQEHLIHSLLPGKITGIQVGLFRVAVMAETEHGIRCGLAATMRNPHGCPSGDTPVKAAGSLQDLSPHQLAGLIYSDSFIEVSIGMATINALVPQSPEKWVNGNADAYLYDRARGKKAAVVGHFPFVDALRNFAEKVWVLELVPQEGDLPAEMEPEILPQADIIAITATTLINKTYNALIPLCRPDAEVILVGPSTPVTSVLFDHGITMAAGTIVTEPKLVITAIGQGITFHQLQENGWVRLVMHSR